MGVRWQGVKEMDPEYVAYCGYYYCRLCGYHSGKLVAAAQQLYDEAKGYRSLELIVKSKNAFDFDEFLKGLVWLAHQDHPCKGCRQGGGWSWRPDCPIRTCCIEKGVDFCYQCSAFPCSTLTEGPLQEYMQRFIEANRQIQRIGLKDWIKQRYGRRAK